MACLKEVLDILAKLVSVIVPVLTIIFVIKGYRLAVARWGRDLKDYDRKEEKEQREKYFNMLDKYIANNNSGLSEFYETLMAPSQERLLSSRRQKAVDSTNERIDV